VAASARLAAGRRAQQEAFVVLLDLGLGERVEIGDNVRPGALATEVGDALLQLLLQDEGEELQDT
jgi:hypothetical protein